VAKTGLKKGTGVGLMTCISAVFLKIGPISDVFFIEAENFDFAGFFWEMGGKRSPIWVYFSWSAIRYPKPQSHQFN
jgi:hypothetical protein